MRNTVVQYYWDGEIQGTVLKAIKKYFGPKYFLIFFPAVVLVVLGVVLVIIEVVASHYCY